ncbi:MAG: FAD-binding oxidoreductase [Sarcina sp.]
MFKKVKENDVVTSFYFRPLDGAKVRTHKAGQFISIKPIKDDETVRQYSLSMKPGEDFYRISVKREDLGKVSRYLHDNVNVGDVVELTSPLGEFYLKENSNKPLVLLSGGIGVTPVLSMLYKALEEKRDVIFLQAVLNSTAHTFKNELKELAMANSNLKTAVFYAEPTATDKIGVDYDVQGFATKEWIEANLPVNGEFYFCGPLGFMKHIYNTAVGMGVSVSDLNYEMFGPSADLANL